MNATKRTLLGLVLGALVGGLPLYVESFFESNIHNDWGSARASSIFLAVVLAAFGTIPGLVVGLVRARPVRGALLGAGCGLVPGFFTGGITLFVGALIGWAVALLMHRFWPGAMSLQKSPPSPG